MLTDPRCPACGEPVGVRATYCMHCDSQFDRPVDGDGSEPRRSGWGDGFGIPEVSDEGDDTGTDRGDPVATDPGGTAAGSGGGEDWLDRYFGPDGLIDDSLTVVIGVVVGVVGGGGVGLLAGLGAWVGVTAWLARQYSVFGAVRGGCYALAVALLALPLVALTDAARGGTLVGQILLFVVGELIFGLFALPLVGVGYAAGKRRPDQSVGTTGPDSGAAVEE
jgi:hypothetical protein